MNKSKDLIFGSVCGFLLGVTFTIAIINSVKKNTDRETYPSMAKVCAVRKGKDCLKYHEAGVDESGLAQGRWIFSGYDESDRRLDKRGPNCRNESIAHEAAVRDPMGDVKYSCTHAQVENLRICYFDANCAEDFE